MATKFEQVKGNYNQKSTDSDTQASNKFGKIAGPGSIKDSGSPTNQKSGTPVDSGDSKLK